MTMKSPDIAQLHELVLQSLEHEKGGVAVYETALECVINEDLKEEWSKYLEETTQHVQVVTQLCRDLGIDPDTETPGTRIVRESGLALVKAMEAAQKAGNRVAAQLVACDCVVLAETKDHANWNLLQHCAEKSTGDVRSALMAAVEEVEDEEDEHLYHSKGWCRELWLDSLGLRAVLPPPEERKHAKTAIGAARAEQSRAKLR
jgi:hypothetical protein